MKKYSEFITEQQSMTFWHGGRLDNAYSDMIAHKKGRWEYGPGLYLTTHYQTAQRYTKGNRLLYQIRVANGNDARNATIDMDVAKGFINQYVKRSARNDILYSLERHKEGDRYAAYIFINAIVNNDAIKSSQTNILRKFLVDNGIDYMLVPNAFGWHEMMMVLFNMDKIIEKKVITPKDKIEQFDLDTEFK